MTSPSPPHDRHVGVLLIGSGSIADYHLAGLAVTARATVRAVAGRNLARAEALTKRFSISEASTDVIGTLARTDIDAVIIATPDHTHEEMAIAAARAGKAILLQKPMASDVAACRRILDSAAHAKVDVQVAFMHRYFEEVELARRFLREGAIGSVQSVHLRNATTGPNWSDWFFDSRKVSGGVVHQLGVHGIDLLLYLLGDIASVSATHATLQPTRRLADGREIPVENPDSAWATYRLAGGAIASHEMSMIEARGCDRFRMEIYGSEGTIWLRSDKGALAICAPRHVGHHDWYVPSLTNPPVGQRHHQHWIDGLTGVSAPASTACDALRGMLVAEAILRSAANAARFEPVQIV
ncbi:MAG: Gfo/Idh/MocA family oxidoreductase [Proteobacteria bacterium]|nr:Gfo/Idh/MocA family oxidoreductase [Pseudomonadota bacterium]